MQFLQDVLDALFNILMENADSKTFDNLVFEALVKNIFISPANNHEQSSQFSPFIIDCFMKILLTANIFMDFGVLVAGFTGIWPEV